MSDQTVLIRFKGEDDVSSTAKTVEESVSNVGRVAEQSGGKFSSMSTIASGALTQIGMSLTTFAGDMAIKALGAVTDFVSGSIAEAAEWQSAFSQTEAVIASTGSAAGLTAKEMADMAVAMSASSGTSLFADDAILGAQNVLATFTQIKGETFAGATQGILDMSQALGQDLQSSSMQVGKALNDPIKGVAALSRVGVNFSEDQKAMIQSLQETGDMAGAQQVILDELTTQFGGSASAAVDTYAGQQIILQEKMAGIQQTLGEALLPIMLQFGTFLSDTLVPILGSVITSISEWINGMNESGTVSGVFETIKSGIAAIPGIFAEIGVYMGMVQVWAQPITDAFMNLVNTAVPALAMLGGAILSVFASPEFQGALATILPLLSSMADVIKNALVLAFNAGAIAWSYLIQGFQFLWPYVQTILNSMYSLVTIVFTAFTGIFNAFALLLSGDFTGAWNTLSTTVQTAVENIWKWIQDTFGKVDTFLGTIGDKFSEIGSEIVAGIAKGISDGAEKIKTAALNAANAAYDAMKTALGIASPSQLMSDKIGLPISQGVAAGIIKGSGFVTSASGLVVQGAAAATTNNYYQLSASYSQNQSEGSIISDLQRMQIQFGGIL
jgi:hypothetical protein